MTSWKVTVDEYAKYLDTELKPGGRYLLTVLGNHVNFVPILGCGIKCCAKGFNLGLDQIDALWEVPAEYSLKSLVIQLKNEPVEADEEPGLPYHKMWVDGTDADLHACTGCIQAARRLRSGDVIVSGYIDGKTCEPTFFGAASGVRIFQASQSLRTAVVGFIETIPVDYGVVYIERLAFGTTMKFKADPNLDEGEIEGAEYSVFVENVGSKTLTITVEEETIVPEDGSKPYKKWVMEAPGSTAKSKTISFNIDMAIILEAEYVAGLAGTLPEPKRNKASRVKSMKKEKKEAPPAPVEEPVKPTSFVGKIKRGLSLKKNTPAKAAAPA